MVDSTLYPYVVAALVTILFYRWRFVDLYHIPTLGPSLPILSYLGAYRFITDNKTFLQEGYRKFRGRLFKVAMLDRWVVVVTGPSLVEELRKLPDEQVSFAEGVDEFFRLHYTFGTKVASDPVHIDVIRNQLTRHISTVFDDVRDEIYQAFNDLLPASSSSWTPIPALPTMRDIVARISNRVFVGFPLCRHEKYLALAVKHTRAVAKSREVFTFSPRILAPFASFFFLGEARRGNQEAMQYIGPVVRQRLDDMQKFGDEWSEKPNDMLQWIIDLTISRGNGIEEIVRYAMLLNFAAIHTSSNTFTHTLYHLASHPGYAQELRQEVDAIVQAEGWNKSSMQKMKKVDSFLRETLRLNGINGLSLTRKALKDMTLSDGTFIPAGTILMAASTATHLDPDNYEDPTVFNPWRFSDMRDKDGEGTRHQLVSTSADYISFGHGKHACPGRFFAANELKTMVAHMVLNYDVKLENDDHRPEDLWVANAIVPNPSATVLFRKRGD